MLARQSLQIEQPITWVIDRLGDRNINQYSINSVAHSVILDYLYDTNSNNNIINNNIINNNIIYNDILPTIPFAPLVEVLVVTDMEIIEEEKDCCVCQEERENTDICRLNCAHTFCLQCIKSVMNTQKKCPLCRAEICQIIVQNEENKVKINGNS